MILHFFNIKVMQIYYTLILKHIAPMLHLIENFERNSVSIIFNKTTLFVITIHRIYTKPIISMMDNNNTMCRFFKT